MPEPIDLATKEAAERRLALLALASEQAEPAGSCLDAELLACLVEGRLNPEQVEICQSHLACCEHCYATWRQLDQDWQQRARNPHRGKILHLFNKKSFLTATGSLLAIAASITVFLNLTTEVDRQTLIRIPEKAAQEQVSTAPAARPANQAEPEQGTPAPAPPAAVHQRLAGEQAVAPPAQVLESRKQETLSRTDSAQPSAQKKAARTKAPAVAADRAVTAGPAPAPAVSTMPLGQAGNAAVDDLLEKKEKATTRVEKEPVPAPSRPQQTVGTMGAQLDNAAETGPATLADWLQNIRESCQGSLDQDQATALTVQGKRLLARATRSPLSAEDQQLIKRILSLLAKQPQTAGQRCQALVELLNAAERGNKR